MKEAKTPWLLFLSIILMVACTKPGPGGNNTLVASPFHHSRPIPYTTIYIKYGAKTFPGTEPGQYDDSKVAIPYLGDTSRAIFTGLHKGQYFLYGVGFDSLLGLPVTGGIPIKITKSSGETDVQVPITE